MKGISPFRTAVLLIVGLGCATAPDTPPIDEDTPVESTRTLQDFGPAATQSTTDVEIVFPPNSGVTDADSIHVRGTLKISGNAAMVRVNGAEAASQNGFATWSAPVRLDVGVNTLVVEVIDEFGLRYPDQATVTITREEPMLVNPVRMLAHPNGQVAWVIDNVFPGNNQMEYLADVRVVEVNLTSGARTIVSHPFLDDGARITDSGGIAYDPNRNEILVGDRITRQVIAINLSNGSRQVISGGQVGAGPTFLSVDRLVVSPTRDEVYATGSSRVHGADLTTGDRRLVASSQQGVGPNVSRTSGLAWDAANDRLVQVIRESFNGPSLLIGINPDTGDRTILSSTTVGMGVELPRTDAVVLDSANNKVLVLSEADEFDVNTINGVVEVDLATGNRTTLLTEAAASTSELPLSQLLDITITPAGVFAVDAALGAVLDLNLSDGSRTVVSGTQRGSGFPILGGFGLDIDPITGAFYVSDTISNGVYRIDPFDGNRTLISSDNLFWGPAVGSGEALIQPQKLVVDNVNDRILIADRNMHPNTQTGAVISLDRATGARTVLADGAVGAGTLGTVEALMYDAANNRVITGASNDTIIEVDLATGDRITFASPLTEIGNNFDYRDPKDISRCGNSNTALIATNSSILQMNIATGALTLVTDPFTGGGPEPFPASVTCDLGNGRAFFSDLRVDGGAGILAVDFATGNRTFVSGRAYGKGPMFRNVRDVMYDAERNAIWVVSDAPNGLILIDVPTGDRVVWSK